MAMAERNLKTPIHSHHQQTISLPSRVNSHDAGIDIEIKQEVISEELNLSLDNLNTETAENVYDADIKIEQNDCQDVTSDDKCLESKEENIDNETKSVNIYNVEIKIEEDITMDDKCLDSFITKEEIKHENGGDYELRPSTTNWQNFVSINRNSKEYSCNVCNKQLATHNTLKRHMMSHIGVSRFSCDICNKRFLQSDSLNKHLRVHTGEQPYSCDLCDKKFNQSSNLIQHKKVHTGEKPHKCLVCHKTFAQSSTLQKHMLVHTGEKPYCCHVCQRSFSQSRSLNQHLRIHSGEKPYRCDICNKSFNQSSNLFKHIKVHTRNELLNT